MVDLVSGAVRNSKESPVKGKIQWDYLMSSSILFRYFLISASAHSRSTILATLSAIAPIKQLSMFLLFNSCIH